MTFTNSTSAAITFATPTVSSNKFRAASTCTTVAVGAKCSVSVTYYPGNTGSTTGTLSMGSDAPNAPHSVRLN